MFANVMPKPIAPIEWPWTKWTPKGELVTRHPGCIEMPNLMQYFDWDSYVVDMPPGGWPRMQHGLELGTRNFKSLFTTACRFVDRKDLIEEKVNIAEITDCYAEWNRRLLRSWRGKIKYFMVGDDYANGDGLLMDHLTWATWIRPQMQYLFDVGLDHGCTVIFHSDGDIGEIMTDLIDMGASILNVEATPSMKQAAEYMGVRIWPKLPRKPGKHREEIL